MADQETLGGMPAPLQRVKVSVSTFTVLLEEPLEHGADVRVTIEGRVVRDGNEDTEAGVRKFYGVKVDTAALEAI